MTTDCLWNLTFVVFLVNYAYINFHTLVVIVNIVCLFVCFARKSSSAAHV